MSHSVQENFGEILHFTNCQATAMRFLLFVAFLVIFAECAANGTKTTKKGHGEPVVCNQYIGQGAVTSDAIKKLDEKLDQLMKLLQPSPYAGNLRIYTFHSNTQRSYYNYLLCN